MSKRGGEETNLTGLKKNFFGFFGVEGWAGPMFSDIFFSVHDLVKKCFFPKSLFNKSWVFSLSIFILFEERSS